MGRHMALIVVNELSSLGAMNFQKWELFSGSPSMIVLWIY